MRIAIYGRVSTSHQVDHQTIEQQHDRLAAHARAHAAEGWVLDPALVFRDVGYSGAALARPGLDRLRDATRASATTRPIRPAPSTSTSFMNASETRFALRSETHVPRAPSSVFTSAPGLEPDLTVPTLSAEWQTADGDNYASILACPSAGRF